LAMYFSSVTLRLLRVNSPEPVTPVSDEAEIA
jgi:hypothetical protein